MKINRVIVLGMVVMCGAIVGAGCGKNTEAEKARTAGIAEKTGVALDKRAEEVADAAKVTAAAAKEAAGQAVQKTGEVIEKAGAAVENAGENMQK